MIYLDNSATTRQHSEVTEIMVTHMEKFFGNPSSLYQLGVESERSIKKSRKQLMEAMSMPDGEIFFTSGGTEADNTAVFGAVKALKRLGNKIVTSQVEHPAVLECCKSLEGEGFEVEYIGVDSQCRLDTEHLRQAIDDKTILVTLMHVNNETGTIMPVDEVKKIMRDKHSPGTFHCDAVQSFGKLLMPQTADLISISGHKIYGPKGSGALYVRKGVNLPAFIVGGGQEHGKRSGTENVAAIAGIGLAADLAVRDRKTEMERIAHMRQYLMENLKTNINDIIVNSPEETGKDSGKCCASVLNVSFLGTRGEVLLHTLEQDNIYVSTGSACSSNKKGRSHVLKAMGLKDKEIEGTIRFSLGRFNDISEMDEVVDKVTSAVRRFRKLGSFR